MGTFTNIDSLITVCYKNEYIEGMVALINHKIGMAMVNGREDAIYEMADYYENLARQSVQYGLQNKWAFNKIISLNIKSYYEPGEIYAEDLISIIDRDDLIISDELRVAVYKILSKSTKIPEDEERYSEKIDSLMKNNLSIQDNLFGFKYYFENAKDHFVDKEYILARSKFKKAYSIAEKAGFLGEGQKKL